MNPSSSRCKGSSDETAPVSDSRPSAADTLGVHRPILLSEAAVARADGDFRFVDLDCQTIPPLRSFAIERSHPLIQSWPPIRAQILTILNQSGIRWSSLGVLRRRQTLRQEGDDTTIVLAVKKGNTDEIVESVEEEIYQVCKSTGNAGLFVEILEDEITRLNEIKYQQKPSGGSSISPTEGDHITGTLGGYVRLVGGANGPEVFAMSCHHVVMPNRLDTPNEYSEAVKPGLGHHIRISQPSKMDHMQEVEGLRKACERHEQEICQLQREVENDPSKARALKKTEHVLSRVRYNLKEALNSDLHFGTVFATSGYKISTSDGCALDWALVDVQHTRLGKNEIPELPEKPVAYRFLREGSPVFHLASLGLNDLVVKSGHTSGTTYGIVSNIKHDCDLLENGSFTSEYVVVGHDGRPFAFRGDSGAFVLNSYGSVVGLLIAGQKRLETSYVTPMTDVMWDIHELTGHWVYLPY